MTKVLIVETNVTRYGKTTDPTGLWLGEAAEFVADMQQAGIAVDYVSPKGGFVPLDPRSMKYTDETILKVYESADFIQRGLTQTLRPDQVDQPIMRRFIIPVVMVSCGTFQTIRRCKKLR